MAIALKERKTLLIIIAIVVIIGGGGYYYLNVMMAEPEPAQPETIVRTVKVAPPDTQSAVVNGAPGAPGATQPPAVQPAPATQAVQLPVASKPTQAAPAATASAPQAKSMEKEHAEADVEKPVAVQKKAKAVKQKQYALNVASLTEYAEAASLASRLKKAGFNAYVTAAKIDGVKWNRVRVGFFKSESEAMKTAKTLERKFGLEDCWIVKPKSAERSKHYRN